MRSTSTATWLGQGVFCCALAVVERAPADLMELVRRRPGPKHWSATERLALFDLAAGELAVYSGRPTWGFAYAKSQRALQERLFGAG